MPPKTYVKKTQVYFLKTIFEHYYLLKWKIFMLTDIGSEQS